MNYFKLLGLVVIAGSSLVSLAEEAPDDLDIGELTVVGSRLQMSAIGPATATTVLTGDQLQRLAPFSLSEALQAVPGVRVIAQGARSGYSSILIWGGEPNFTAVYVDGIPLNDSTNSRGGAYDFSLLSVNQIERVEVIRGAQSAVFGSDALSGVVNIVTRRPADGASAQAEIAAGDSGYSKVSAYGALGLGEHAISVSGYTVDDGDPVPGSEFETAGGRVAGAFKLPGGFDLNVQWSNRGADAKTFPEDSGGNEFAQIRDLETRDYQEDVYVVGTHGSLGDAGTVNLRLSRLQRNEKLDSPGIADGAFGGVPPNESDTDFERDLATLVWRSAAGSSVRIAAGAEYRDEMADSRGLIDFGFPIPADFQFDRSTFALFAETNLTLNERLLLNLGIRRDDADGLSAETSPRIGINYGFASVPLNGRLHWGEAFKIPSIFALAQPLIANPDLRPETSQSFGAGLDLEFVDARQTVSVDIHRTAYTDLIDFDPQLFTNVNRSKVITRGADLRHSWRSRAESWAVTSFIGYLDTNIRDSDSELRGRPPWRGGITADWDNGQRWSASASVLYTDEVFESSVATGLISLDAYVRVDAAVTFAPADDWQVAASVQNLLDEDYSQAVGFPAPGARWRLALRYLR